MNGRAIFAIGFAVPLMIAGAVFLAVWKWMERMERGYLNPR